MTIYDASVKYQAEGVPLIVIAGRSTDQARRATGRPKDRGARRARRDCASYERIHRSNLVGMESCRCNSCPTRRRRVWGLRKSSVRDHGLAAVLAEGFPRGKELVVQSTRPEGSSVQSP